MRVALSYMREMSVTPVYKLDIKAFDGVCFVTMESKDKNKETGRTGL